MGEVGGLNRCENVQASAARVSEAATETLYACVREIKQ